MATRTTSLYLVPLALGVLVGQRFYAITKTALVPTCLPPGESLVTANSFLTRVGATTGIAAAVVGALVHRILGVGAVLRLASLVYLAMGFFAFLLPAPRPAGGRRRIRMPGAAARDDDGPDPPDETVAPEPAHGVMLRPAFRAIGGLRALSGFLLFLLAFALRRDGASTTGFGVLLLGIGIGALVSSVGAPFLARRVREETLVAGAYFAAAAITLLTATWYSLAGAAFLAGIVGTSFGMAKLAFDSMAQRGLPRTIQGTLFARWEMAFQLCWVAGALIPVAININTRLALVAGGLAAAAGAVNYALEVARVRRAMASGRVPRAPMSGLRLPSI
jgi:hypothetical protein